jgi:hypothetical protein
LPAAQQAERHLVADEHPIDGLKIEFCGQVHHRGIFAAKIAVSFGGVAVPSTRWLNISR